MTLPLQNLRKSRGITQAEFSQIMNVAPSTIGMWEKGYREPDYDNLKRIANYFNVSTDYLLGNDTGAATLAQEETTLLEDFRSLTAEKKQTLFNMLAFLKSPQSA